MSEPVTLLPRLSDAAADQMVAEAADTKARGEGLTASEPLPDAIAFGPVGGSPVDPAKLVRFRDDIIGIARKAGFPDDRSLAARTRFDVACAIYLAGHPLLQSGEALRNDVWTFIATGLLRQVTVWRYDLAPERWHGGARNTYQRLWMRARALDRGEGASARWELVESLTEDAFVGIVERPSIAGDRTIAVALAEGWLRAAGRHGRGAMEPLMRKAVIRLRLRNEILALSTLSPEQLAGLVDEAFGVPVSETPS